MRFTPHFLEEIKTRLPVSQVVSKRVRLKKEGREFRGLSPFTSEKTPSFYVNDQKMRWFDFSSGKNGNIFDFVMETEGLSFPEAVERLAGEAGIALPQLTQEEVFREAKRASVIEAMDMAAAYFEQALQRPEGARARGALSDRMLGPGLQKEFRIGYAPREKFGLRDYLANKGVDAATMIEGGLLTHGDGIAVPYDRFRDRIMFPIADRSGRTIAFGGRALDKDAQAKYLNSPETSLFHKGSILYNHHRARQAAHKTSRVIAVEGYIDVIAMHQAGFSESVAGLGTALTPDQCQLLWSMAEEPILCFDGDRAGRKAAFRAIDTALPLLAPGRSLRFAFLPDGQDPDDVLRNSGPAALSAIVEKARPLADVLWMREIETHPLDTPERRAAFEQRALAAAQMVGDESLRRHYREEFAQRLAALFGRDQRSGRRQPGASDFGGQTGGARGEWKGRTGGRGAQRNSAPLTISGGLARSRLFSSEQGIASAREAQILLTVFNHPSLVEDHAEALAAAEIENSDLRRLRDVMMDAAGSLQDGDFEPDIEGAVLRAGLMPVLQKLQSMVVVSSLWSVRPEAAALDAGETLRQALVLHRRTRALHRELLAAEAALADDANDLNYARLRDIKAQLAALDGAEAAIEGFGALSGRQPKAV